LADDKPTNSLREVIRIPDFRRVLGASVVSGSGDWLYNSALITYVLTTTGSAGWLAVASTMRLAPQILLGPVGGLVADRWDRRKLLVTCDLLRAALMGVLAFVASADIALILILAVAGCCTAAGTPYFPAVAALTPAIVGERRLATANALAKGAEQIALGLGPAVGGVLLALGSPAIAFGANGLSFLVSAALIARLDTTADPGIETHETSIKEGLVQGIRLIRSSPHLITLVSLLAAVALTLGQGFVLLPLAAREILNSGPEGVGFLFTAIGIGGLIAAVPASHLAQAARTGRIVALGVIVAGVAMALMSRANNDLIAYGLMAVEGATTITLSIVVITTFQRLLPMDQIGRVFGLLQSLAVGSIMLGTLIAPVTVGTTSTRTALVISGAFLGFVAVIAFPKLSAIDEVSATRSAEISPRVAILEATGIFTSASRTTLEALAIGVREERVTAGTEVIREGDPADDFFVIIEGSFDVTLRGQAINTMGAGDHFGEIGLIQEIPRTATVTATADSLVYRIDGDNFLEAVSHAPSDALVEAMMGRIALTHPTKRPSPGAAPEPRS
jgi:MFS family permease